MVLEMFPFLFFTVAKKFAIQHRKTSVQRFFYFLFELVMARVDACNFKNALPKRLFQKGSDMDDALSAREHVQPTSSGCRLQKTHYSLPEIVVKANSPTRSYYLFSCTFNKNVIFFFLLIKLQGILRF